MRLRFHAFAAERCVCVRVNTSISSVWRSESKGSESVVLPIILCGSVTFQINKSRICLRYPSDRSDAERHLITAFSESDALDCTYFARGPRCVINTLKVTLKVLHPQVWTVYQPTPWTVASVARLPSTRPG